MAKCQLSLLKYGVFISWSQIIVIAIAGATMGYYMRTSHAFTRGRESGARQGGVRVVGWPPWMLDHGQWPPWIWAMFRIFYQVIFPVNKQGSIESPPRKQRLENDAKEREKQTIVSKKQLYIVDPIMQAVIGAHCKNFTGSRTYVASFIRCGSDSLDITGHIVSRLQKRFTL